MAGIQFVIQGTAGQVLEAVRTVAQKEGFEVSADPDGRLTTRKGNFVLSIALGAFIAYCDFKFAAVQDAQGAVQLTLTRNNPWWTGLIGISRVKKAANRLADGLGQLLGPSIQSRKDI